ncbi:hypothetical protein QQP08_000866 [Theobroma cacao]|nr:hypothetical protein QQP08_000866 [Theobroma cacao]
MLMGLPLPLITISCILLLFLILPSVSSYKSGRKQWMIIVQALLALWALLSLLILNQFKDGLATANFKTTKLSGLRHAGGWDVPWGLVLLLVFFLVTLWLTSNVGR